MMYDFTTSYTLASFRALPPKELKVLFEEACQVVLDVQGRKLIKKISKDISDMRRLLNGFDSTYNREHPCLVN